MSQERDTGYLAGARLGATEGSQCDHRVHTPLHAYLFSVHLNSSYPVSFPLTYSCDFSHSFSFSPVPPGTLGSLIQLSSFSFQSACFSTPSFCEELRDRSKDNQTSFYSLALISLPFAPLISPHFCSSLLNFPFLESISVISM